MNEKESRSRESCGAPLVYVRYRIPGASAPAAWQEVICDRHLPTPQASWLRRAHEAPLLEAAITHSENEDIGWSDAQSAHRSEPCPECRAEENERAGGTAG